MRSVSAHQRERERERRAGTRLSARKPQPPPPPIRLEVQPDDPTFGASARGYQEGGRGRENAGESPWRMGGEAEVTMEISQVPFLSCGHNGETSLHTPEMSRNVLLSLSLSLSLSSLSISLSISLSLSLSLSLARSLIHVVFTGFSGLSQY